MRGHDSWLAGPGMAAREVTGRAAVLRGMVANMGDIDVKKLSLDFSQDRDSEDIRARVLAFLKDDVAESGTVTCVIREAGEVGEHQRRQHTQPVVAQITETHFKLN